MKPYYRVNRVGLGHEPRVQHPTLEEASAEALRLAGQHPGETFEILKVLGIARTSEPSIFWCDDCGAEDVVEDEPARYPTTPLPEGFDRWECRGCGWKPGRKAKYTVVFGPNGTSWGRPVDRVPNGEPAYTYWEAVKDEPRYRMLEPGELIVEGDEFNDPRAGWVPTKNGSAAQIMVYLLGEYRRPVKPEPAYRDLAEGEMILTGDEYQDPDGAWHRTGCAGAAYTPDVDDDSEYIETHAPHRRLV